MALNKLRFGLVYIMASSMKFNKGQIIIDQQRVFLNEANSFEKMYPTMKFHGNIKNIV